MTNRANMTLLLLLSFAATATVWMGLVYLDDLAHTIWASGFATLVLWILPTVGMVPILAAHFGKACAEHVLETLDQRQTIEGTKPDASIF